MAVIKCKMCGGALNITPDATIAECEYCGSRQTIPSQDSEKKLTQFARADRLRRACEFDKAAGVYETIVADFPEEAEAYWGLVLCRYGIEYVDDPATGRKIPTCHRSSFGSVMEDADFEQACENADAAARRIYREEAKAIEGIRKGILEVSEKEEPYDIFICYKETDENGSRTEDSVIAQNVYDALTKRGYWVFFSRISLEDKLGSEYEPYIFAALHSAKLMLVFGTKAEYFEAVWVKNEWSRFLALIAAGQKKTLIPCYKGLTIQDLPQEFQRLQVQDMGAAGAIQDLLRGVEKILPQQKKQQGGQLSADVSTIMRRGRSCLEDRNWQEAAKLFEQALDLDPECSDAYVGKLCVELKAVSEEQIVPACSADADTAPLDDRPSFIKALRFASQARKEVLEGYRSRVYVGLSAAAKARAEKIDSDIRQLERSRHAIAEVDIPENEGALSRVNGRISDAESRHRSRLASLTETKQRIQELSQPMSKKELFKVLFALLFPMWLFWRIGDVISGLTSSGTVFLVVMLLGELLGPILAISIVVRRSSNRKRAEKEAQALDTAVENTYHELSGCRAEQDKLENTLTALRQKHEKLGVEMSSSQQRKEYYLKMMTEYQKKAA